MVTAWRTRSPLDWPVSLGLDLQELPQLLRHLHCGGTHVAKGVRERVVGRAIRRGHDAVLVLLVRYKPPVARRAPNSPDRTAPIAWLQHSRPRLSGHRVRRLSGSLAPAPVRKQASRSGTLTRSLGTIGTSTRRGRADARFPRAEAGVYARAAGALVRVVRSSRVPSTGLGARFRTKGALQGARSVVATCETGPDRSSGLKAQLRGFGASTRGDVAAGANSVT